MNVIRLMGGIGNQLFQWAFGKAMNTEFAMEHGFYDETKEMRRKYPRPFRLDKFGINYKHSLFLKQPTIKESSVGFDMKLLQLRNHNFDGYWQYVGYYYDIREELKSIYHVREEFHTEYFLKWKQRIESEESIGVHVRRGDYLIQTWGVLPTQYYFEAIRKVPDGPLFIFSDDLKWCREVFKEEYFSRKIYFVGLLDYLDFELLRCCKHVIMASSTFSWWTAFLSEGMVVVPSRWLGNKYDPTLVHYPKEWIKIEM